MLFDGSIRYLERSLSGFGLDDPAECNQTINNNIIRAQDIIRELNSSLNMEAGGEFAATLRRLYFYFDHRLLECNLRKESAGIREVIGHLTVLREAWSSMLQGQTSSDAGNPMLELAAA
jgi:flagellar protein FliS